MVSNATDNSAVKIVADNNSLAISSEEKRDGITPITEEDREEDGDIFDPEILFSDKEACRLVSSVRRSKSSCSSSSSSRALQEIVQFALTIIEVNEFPQCIYQPMNSLYRYHWNDF